MKTITQDVSQALQDVREQEGPVYIGRFVFDARLPIFKGHFPGHPIVPGVYLLECAWQTFLQAWKKPARLRQVKSAKFTAPVHPPCEVTVTVEPRLDGTTCKADCTVRMGETVAAVALLEMEVSDAC